MFDASGITSKLGLDVSGFASGMLQATSIAETFPSVVTSFLANPLLGLINVAKLAADAAVEVGKAWVGAIERTANWADDIGDLSASLGVSTTFLSGWGAALKDGGASVETFGEALQHLNRVAADAAAGNKEALAAFGKVGINKAGVEGMLGNTEGLAKAASDGLSHLSTQAERAAAAQDLFGRGVGKALGVLSQGSGEVDKFAERVARMGGVVDADLAAMGDQWGKLSTLASAAMQGIEAAAARPVLAALQRHGEAVEKGIEDVAVGVEHFIARAVGNVVAWLEAATPAFKGFGSQVQELAHNVESVLIPPLKLLAMLIKDIVEGMNKLSKFDFSPLQGILNPGQAIGSALGQVAQADYAAAYSKRGAGPGYTKFEEEGGTITINLGMNATAGEIGEAIKKAVDEATKGHKTITNMALAQQRQQQAIENAFYGRRQ